MESLYREVGASDTEPHHRTPGVARVECDSVGRLWNYLARGAPASEFLIRE
jgi:hypothetical protein